MKIPKYVKDKIYQRARLAGKYLELDDWICDWMQKHNIDSEYALNGYVDTLCGTYVAARQCIEDIENS